MEYIKDELLKQPKEIQKIFIDWWKPSIGDLFIWNDSENYHDMHEVNCCSSKNMVDMTIKNKGIECGQRIPLLTEYELRQFVEEMSGGKIRIIEYDFDHYNVITWKEVFVTKQNDLLKAYFEVAVKIAEQILEEKSNDD